MTEQAAVSVPTTAVSVLPENGAMAVFLPALPSVPHVGAPITDVGVASIAARVAQTVGFVDDIETLQEWRSEAAAFEAYLRSKGLQRPMLGAQRRVEARIGQLLGEPQPGRRSDLEPPTHASEVERERDGHTARDFRILAHAMSGETVLTDDEWCKSRRALISLVRQRLGLIPETPELPVGKYNVIVADPPWRLDTGPSVFGGTIERGHDSLAYEQMSVEDIKSLDVQSRAADDSHLYLWTTNRYVESAYEVARAWGFKPSVLLVWAKKPRGTGLGDAWRLTTEFCLYARRGSLKEKRVINTTWFTWPRGKHSEKPKAFYELVESVSPGNDETRLEMFARASRRGWKRWGHEAPT